MRLRYTLICCLILFASGLQAQKSLIKAYEALKVFNYFEAHKIFKEELRKDKIVLSLDSVKNTKQPKNPQEPAAAAYGLGIIFLKTDNPFSNVDSAYAYTNLAAYYFGLATPEQRAKLTEKGIPVDSAGIITQYIGIYGRAYSDAKRENTIPAYQSFITRFPFASQVEGAKQNIEDIAWENTLKQNTFGAYDTFALSFPSSARLKEAREKYELRLFEAQTQDNSITSYQNFIAAYPASPYHGAAEDSIYSLSVSGANVAAYAAFIRGNSQNRNIGKAWDELYNLYNADGSEATLKRFKDEFPDYPGMEKLGRDLAMAGIVLLPVEQNGKWGYIDTTGKVIIAPRFDFADVFSDGIAAVEIEGKTGYINKSGQKVIDAVYEEATAFDGNYAIAKKGEKYGVIGRVGNVVLPFEYDDISAINELTVNGKAIYVATFTKGSAQGFIDLTNTVQYPDLYEETGDFYQNLAVVKKGGLYGYMGANGTVVIDFIYEWADNFMDNGLARVKKSGMLGLINRNGQEIAAPKYATLTDFKYGLALVSVGGVYGFINTKGEETIKPQYPFAMPFEYNAMLNDTIAKVEYKGKRGYINTKDKSALPIKYDDSTAPAEGLVGVKEKGKWGFVDKSMKTVIPFKFETVGSFKNGMAVAKLKGKKGLIDKKGKWLVEAQYDEILDKYAADCYFVVLGDEYGLIDTKGAELLPTTYSEPEHVRGNIYRLVSNEKASYYNIQTKQFIWKE